MLTITVGFCGFLFPSNHYYLVGTIFAYCYQNNKQILDWKTLMLEGYDFWLILLSLLASSVTLHLSCSFIKCIYLSTPTEKATLLPIYSITIGCVLFCVDNLNWVAMQPVINSSQLSVPMMLASLALKVESY